MPLRRAAYLKQPPGARRRVAETQSLPAPVGGWNARDSIAAMDPMDALKMENWFPTPADVRLRKGWAEHVTGIGDQVESLMPYNEADGTESLFAAAGSAFYDVSSSGAVGSAVVSGLSNARWQHVNFMNSSGTAYLCNFNGTDKPRYWEGSTWTAVDGVSTPAITGVTTSNLDNPWIHKRRMWMIEVDTLSAWYLPVDAVGGAASKFDLSGLFKRGGSLVAGGTWTIDAGEGLDDYWVAVSSEGEVIAYTGTDPSSSSTWRIAGIWSIGEPLGKRCLMKYQGDLLIILRDGVMPLSAALQSSRVDPTVAITDKIRGHFTDVTDDAGSNFGWQILHYAGGDMLIVNVPVSEGSGQEQYAMNTITQTWGRFLDISANCWAIHNDEPYFGGDGVVGKFWGTGVLDDNGSQIKSDLKQAFSYFGDRGGLKRWTMIRPIFKANLNPNLTLGLNTDYDDDEPSGAVTFSPLTFGEWDSAVWDSGIWGGGLQSLENWQSVNAFGTSAALRMKLNGSGIEVRFQAADYVFERGGVI